MIEEFISANKSVKLNAIIIGDVGIDCFHYGKISRISPEFPVVVLNSQTKQGEQLPGMAANVCYQMTHFNVNVFLLGLIDCNTSDLLNKYSFNTDFCVLLVDGKNPIKTRFYDGNYPLLRWDIEQANYGESEEEINFLQENLLNNFYKIVEDNEINIVVLSDYNKGLFDAQFTQKIINFCNNRGIPTIVDPKKKPLSKWNNCTYFKPNLLEVKNLTFDGLPEDQIKKISTDLECKGVVVTQEGLGFMGIINGELFDYKTEVILSPEKVNSTIGAGDAFLAMLAICIGHKIDFIESCKLAFRVGVEYVQTKHNRPVSIHDLKHNFGLSKIIDDIEFFKNRNYKLVFTNGCFDLGLTVGHVECLKFAKQQGDKLIVAVNGDESVARLKGPKRPIVSIGERIKIIAALECVDYVVSFDEDTPLEIIKRIKPDLIVKGGDYNPEDVVGKEIAEVKIFPLVKCLSTTEKLKQLFVGL